MSLLDLIRGKLKNKNEGGGLILSLSSINDFFGRHYQANGPDIAVIAYFICMKTLAESMGKLPCYIRDKDYRRVKNQTSLKLEIAPNDRQTASEFWTTMEFERNHYGNAFAFCKWNAKTGELEGLHRMDPRYVTIWVNNTDDFTERPFYYRYQDVKGGNDYMFDPSDVLHFKSWIKDDTGLVGKAVREILNSYFSGDKAAQSFQNDLYQKGMTANAVLKYVGDLSGPARKKMLEQMKEITANRNDRILPIPMGWDIQPLNLNLQDSQFLETRKYSALQIAAAFGIQPNFLNDYSKSSYANSTAQQLSFLTNTLLPIVRGYELELTRKLLREDEIKKNIRIKFNTNVLLRVDPLQQANMLSKYVQGSIYTPNEARAKVDLPPYPGGDKLITTPGGKTLENGEGGETSD